MKSQFFLFFVLLSLSCFSQNEELDTLTIQLAYESSDSSKVAISLKIIKNLIAIKDFDKALEHIKQSKKLSKKLKSDKTLAQLFFYKALVLSEKDDYINSVNLLDKSKSLSIKLNDSLLTAKVNSKLGALQIKHGDYKKGIINTQKGIYFLEQKKDSSSLSEAYKTLASAYATMNQLENAQDFYNKSIAIDKNTRNQEALINSYIALAELYVDHKQYNDAVINFEQALNLISTTNEKYYGRILPKLGEAYIHLENLELANTHLNKGLKINRLLKDTEGITLSLNGLAELNKTKKRYRTATKFALEANKYGEILNDDKKLFQTYALLKELDSLQGNFKKAYFWQSKYFTAKSRLDKESEEKKQLANTLMTIDIEDTIVAPLQIIENPVTKPEPQASNQFKFIFYFLIIAFVVVIIVFIIFFIKRKHRLKYTTKLEEKNKEIKLQNKSILEQKKHLESINDVKDKLFSIVSHDLRDSLISTKEFIDLLKDGSLSQDEFKSLLPELSENANNATLLLFNLLNWSKSQMQSLKSKPSLFDIQEVIHQKINLITSKTQSKNIKVIDNTLNDFVYADRSMIEIIIQNVLANAVKFCRSGDTITISNLITNGYALITITDSGIGITEENQQKLFSKESISTIGTDNEKGTGLGLTICKDLVELNNGRIWVESEINKGSSFYIELPKSKVEIPKLV